MLLVCAAALPGWSQAGQQQPGDSRDSNVYVGQQPSVRNFPKKFVLNVLFDQKEIWTSPFHIDRNSAKWWIFAGAGAAALLAADRPASKALPASGSTLRLGTDASRAGRWYSVVPAAGALFGLGFAGHNKKLAETGALGLEALADTGIVTTVMKVAARRERPLTGDGGGHFEKGGSSFPSGHSAEAWALATVIASEYGKQKWVPISSYSYAALISTSRVLAQAHFTSDVFVGGAIGFFTGRYVVRTQKMHREHAASLRTDLMRPAVLPAFSPGEHSVKLAWNY